MSGRLARLKPWRRRRRASQPRSPVAAIGPPLDQPEGGTVDEPTAEEQPASARLVWLNGPPGVGATTVAETLAAGWGTVVFDAEGLGRLLLDIVPHEEHREGFYDLALWRSSIRQVGAELAHASPLPPVMPASVWHPTERSELLDGFRRQGVDVMQVVLLADEVALADRIHQRRLYDEEKRSRLRRMRPALDALRLSTDGMRVDTSSHTPGQIAEAVAIMAHRRGWTGGGPCHWHLRCR